eukprot:gene30637-35651_t
MIGFTLFRRLAGSDDGKVTKDKFVEFCTQRGMLLAPADRRVFDSLRQDGKEYLTHDDFMPLMDCLLLYHPGLEFLKVSYEHFYVLYCKFWELDTDHDFMIDKDNLAHYSQCALSYQIIERIFEQCALSYQIIERIFEQTPSCLRGSPSSSVARSYKS